MKTSTALILSFMALARRVSINSLELQWDPETAPDCVEWYDNSEGESCEHVRSYFGITPDQFHKWNPSVGLDCTPWRWQSYCIVTLERLQDTNKTTSAATRTATPATTTSTAAPLGPSPTGWIDLGCYAEDPDLPIMEKNMSPLAGGDDGALTVAKCQDACYRARFKFTGLQAGTQCWCSNYVGGTWAGDQAACNTPCPGDAAAFCGGKGVVAVYEAEPNRSPGSETATGTGSAAVVGTGSAVSGGGSSSSSSSSSAVQTRSSSGAVRNVGLF